MTRLLEEIKQYQSEFRQKAPAEKQRLMAEATAELAASGVAQGLGHTLHYPMYPESQSQSRHYSSKVLLS